jgi:hypothetical protein
VCACVCVRVCMCVCAWLEGASTAPPPPATRAPLAHCMVERGGLGVESNGHDVRE